MNIKNFAVTILLIIVLIGCAPKEATYTLIKEGEVSRVEYIQGNFSARDKTAIYFTDGTCIVSRCHRSVPHKKIRVIQDSRYSNGYFTIEQLI